MIPRDFHPEAWEEYEEILARYAEEGPELVADFTKCVAEYILLIRQNPLLFHERRFTVRRANLRPRFGEYYIAFILWREKVVILAIAHGKRRPFYFRDRIGEARRMY